MTENANWGLEALNPVAATPRTCALSEGHGCDVWPGGTLGCVGQVWLPSNLADLAA